MKKLSKAQEAMLRRMGEGGVLVQCHFGPDLWFRWLTGKDWRIKGLRYDTVLRLRQRGFIGNTTSDWSDPEYAITPAGRAYLEENS